MKSLYLFPCPFEVESRTNSYTIYLLESLRRYFKITNSKAGHRKGILDVWKNRNSDVFIINWPENIPSRSLGLLQLGIYIIVLIYLKLRHKSIVWILHNKSSHKENTILGRISVAVTSFFHTLCLTHSEEGIKFYSENCNKREILYFPHPPYKHNNSNSKNVKVKFDFLIWGSIERYKNVLEFVKFFSANCTEKQTLFICGKCKDQEYLEELTQLCNSVTNISFYNRFFKDEEILDFIQESKAIIFPYDTKSLLSSGSLIFSLAAGKIIWGPNSGAFRDLANMGLVTTYQDYTDVLSKEGQKIEEAKLKKYIQDYSWENLAYSLAKKIG